MAEYPVFLQQIVVDVCQTMLGFKLCDNDPVDSIPELSAAVEFHGAHGMVLEVFANLNLATRFASTMFSTEPHNLNREDICDALGEVANMIGGNLRGFLGEEVDLSLPTVGESSATTWKRMSADVVMTFLCDGLPLMVVLRDPTSEYSASELTVSSPETL